MQLSCRGHALAFQSRVTHAPVAEVVPRNGNAVGTASDLTARLSWFIQLCQFQIRDSNEDSIFPIEVQIVFSGIWHCLLNTDKLCTYV